MRNYISLSLFVLYNICFAGKLNVLELSHDLGPDTPYFDTSVKEPYEYEIVQAGYTDGNWLAVGKYSAYEHLGSHVDAPFTYYEFGIKIDEIPLDQFFAEAAVIDVSAKVASTDNYEISVQDVKDWVEANGVFPQNCIVLLYTGWEKGRYPDSKKYFGDSNISDPGISIAAIDEILSYEKSHGVHIASIGIDASSIDLGRLGRFPSSSHFASFNKYQITNMRNLESLPARGAKLMIAPLKLRGGTASQMRVFARLPYET